MKNVTITLDERVAKWARMRAAELNTSVSRLVGEMLQLAMRQERGYELAMRRYLSAGPQSLSGGKSYPRREELHARPRVR